MRISIHHHPINDEFDGLLISGGDDISPEHYDGDINAKVKSDPSRDILEMDWIKKAIAENKPLLGICRGAQLINVVLEGSLYEDIREMRQLTHNRPGLLPTKRVDLKADSVVQKVCGKAHIWVNSLHHQAINQAGQGLQVVGQDRDHIVQAVEAEKRHIIGVQWHPEYLSYLPTQFRLFRWLVKQAGKRI